MTRHEVTTKAELRAEIDRTWTDLNIALGNLTEMQLTSAADAQGWTVKDHLVHLVAWERSAVYFLQGKPRHESLGVDEGLYLNGGEDAINAAVNQQGKELPLAEVRTQLRAVHGQLLRLLEPLTDDDLRRPYRHYLPDEPGEGDGPPAIDVIRSNSASHFVEHLAWIEVLVQWPS